MPFYLLLAMQAAGMIVDYMGTKNQAEMMTMGLKLNQAGLEANLAQSKLEAEEATVQGLKQLRQTLGSQIAIFAARGTSTAGGSAVNLLNESIGNFNSDERIRRLNQLARENAIRGNMTISSLRNSADISKLWQGFTQRTINRFPSNFSKSPFNSNGAKEGFGLTKVGSY